MAPIANLVSLILSLLTWAVAKKFQYDNQKESMGREGQSLKHKFFEHVAHQKQSRSFVCATDLTTAAHGISTYLCPSTFFDCVVEKNETSIVSIYTSIFFGSVRTQEFVEADNSISILPLLKLL